MPLRELEELPELLTQQEGTIGLGGPWTEAHGVRRLSVS